MTIEQNCADTDAARHLVNCTFDMLRDDFHALPSDASRVKFLQILRDRAIDVLAKALGAGAEPEALPPVPKTDPTRKYASQEIEAALEMVDEINELSTQVEWDDALNVAARATSIAESIESIGRVSVGQKRALENMLHAMQKWTRD